MSGRNQPFYKIDLFKVKIDRANRGHETTCSGLTGNCKRILPAWDLGVVSAIH